ncbi:MAG: hypothetical protein M1831_000053 [Alyxoria varia]|nr:MAG: hypothetical protein M1831_000053 [Alyxoria varia]
MPPSRRRISSLSNTVQDHGSESSDVAPAHARLRSLVESIRSLPGSRAIHDVNSHDLANSLHELRLILVDSAYHYVRAKDDFRHAAGFEAICGLLNSLHGLERPLASSALRHAYNISKSVLNLLAEALNEHNGNRYYFANRLSENGWEVTQHTLQRMSGETLASEDPESRLSFKAKLFDQVFAFALAEETFTAFSQVVSHDASDENSRSSEPAHYQTIKPKMDTENERARNTVEKAISRPATLSNPEVVPIILLLWLDLQNAEDKAISRCSTLSAAVLMCLNQIARCSEYNTVSMHQTGCLRSLLRSLFDQGFSDNEKVWLTSLSLELMRLGFNTLNDAAAIFKEAYHSKAAAKFLFDAIEASRAPARFHFDLSLQGFASLEIRELKGSFPPTTSNSGYTYSAWLRIVEFDESCHTTIFGAFDESQTCFLLLYLERGSRQLVLQSAAAGERPSVRFKSVTFAQGVWYHIAIVHRLARAKESSKAALFIDGELREQIKCQYPSAPPKSAKPKASGESQFSLPQDRVPVQAFFGTPRELSPRLGRGMLQSKWELASAHLFCVIVPDDLLYVYHSLGPSYCGNFQDCLGSFQSYRASATLNLRNERLHPKEGDTSMIVHAIRSRAGKLISEENMLLGINTATVFEKDLAVRAPQHKSNYARANSRHYMQRWSRTGLETLTVNTAVPQTSHALSKPFGVAYFAGGVVVSNPNRVDDASCELCGCVPWCLNLIRLASTEGQLVQGLKIIFELVQMNWRASEAFERDNGFATLAWLLRNKFRASGKDTEILNQSTVPSTDKDEASLSLKLLRMVLEFVGYNFIAAEESLIINPLAYRMLLVDSDLWRTSDAATQQLYYEQFVTFAVNSQNWEFNSKRLNRMRIAKKFLEALKAEVIEKRSLSMMLRAFKVVLQRSNSADVYRSLALYITYAISSGDRKISSEKNPRTSKARPSDKLDGSSRPGPTRTLTPESKERVPSQDLGVSALQMFEAILCSEETSSYIRRFAKTVTNKWLLNLLSDRSERVVLSATKILARLLIVNGPGYVKKFNESTKGFTLVQARLRSWWRVRDVWTTVFALLLGIDIPLLDFVQGLDCQVFSSRMNETNQEAIFCPQAMDIILSLMEEGVKETPKQLLGATSSTDELDQPEEHSTGDVNNTNTDARREVLYRPLQFLGELHGKVAELRDLTGQPNFVRDLLRVLYLCMGSITESKDTGAFKADLFALDEGITEYVHVTEESESQLTEKIERSSTWPQQAVSNQITKAQGGARSASITRRDSQGSSLGPQHIEPSLRDLDDSDRKLSGSLEAGNDVCGTVCDILMMVFFDQVLSPKDFNGLGLFLNAPPCTPFERSRINTMIMDRALLRLHDQVSTKPSVLTLPKVLFNIARFASQTYEAFVEGWYVQGGPRLILFSGKFLELAERYDLKDNKYFQLSSPALSTIQDIFRRSTILVLNSSRNDNTVNLSTFIHQLQTSRAHLFLDTDSDDRLLRPLCFVLYEVLKDSEENVFLSAASILHEAETKRPDDFWAIFTTNEHLDEQHSVNEFVRYICFDKAGLKTCLESEYKNLDKIITTTSKTALERFITQETEASAKSKSSRSLRRKERLEKWHLEGLAKVHTSAENEISAKNWNQNIYLSEVRKNQRSRQDHQENLDFLQARFTKQQQELARLDLSDEQDFSLKWQLDECEGRDRMRMRIAPLQTAESTEYQPRYTRLQRASTMRSVRSQSSPQARSRSNSARIFPIRSAYEQEEMRSTKSQTKTEDPTASNLESEDFEIIAPPSAEEDDEDKNRKVMRSLEKGEHVRNVYNISRIVGLEAVEGLLIIGKHNLYLINNLFQRSDGEIVNTWRAPQHERDDYTRIISGNEVDIQQSRLVSEDYSVSHWRWAEVVSYSKRRFLFRDVALEIFFSDGRSYLLTTAESKGRDRLHADLTSNTADIVGKPVDDTAEGYWGLERLKKPKEATSSFGAKLTNVLSPMLSDPMTKKWVKGEISNFYYLMLINTMAGRTFNDLTQYPVFPWVLADYTSEELDLTNPRSFRDLSKPMGCQSVEREMTFRERYNSFAEMDDQTPPFHYGTHYSSAMIVTSFLIRLQPFVHSHILLQGGSFDHADRLFNSIGQAWVSASKDTISDVRELIPEFFYLPELFVNLNNYNFGTTRDGTGEKVNNVHLPPWAKGDPYIFVAKHREALESKFVSQNLHNWIDLVFGFKQRGEAAIESTNVFHHLSYHGSKDLDSIKDQLERAATIGIIHNFGQTPRQVFARPHVRRDVVLDKKEDVLQSVRGLVQKPLAIYELRNPIHSIQYSPRLQRLIASVVGSSHAPPQYNIIMQWNHGERSVRFLSADHRKTLGIFEQLHIRHISTALFADSSTVITAGEDCIISAWTFSPSQNNVDLHPKATLFGHRSPIAVLTVSKAFGILLSASADGSVIIWDLNRLELIRKISVNQGVYSASINERNGHIMLSCGEKAYLFTLNGHLLIEQTLHADRDGSITSCAFHESEGHAWVGCEVIFTGHKSGVINAWNVAISSDGQWECQHLRTLERPFQYQNDANKGSAAVHSVIAFDQRLYSGTEDGRVFEWSSAQ